MFDQVADRYDIANDLMSLGTVRAWRFRVLEAVDPRPGEMVLDLAAGTGTSSEPFVAAGAAVAATDMSLGMLTVGRERRSMAGRSAKLAFVAGDALRLPYADNSFDAATISFGLRNVEDPAAALVELGRVVRPGGRLVVCEFSTPTWPPLRALHRVVVGALTRLARPVSSNPSAYDYLAESIAAWPDQPALAEMISAAGWRDVAWRNLSHGIVALHRAYR